MQVKTFSVKFTDRTAGDEHDSGSERFNFKAPVFEDFESLDLEDLRDWLKKNFKNQDAEKTIVSLVNSSVQSLCRSSADPDKTKGGTAKVVKSMGTFVNQLVDPERSDEFKAELARLNPGFATAVAGLGPLVATEDDQDDEDEPESPEPSPEPSKGKKGKGKRK